MTAPICPGCGAKFSHDNATRVCRKCGIPDEIISMGPTMIARWKHKTLGKRTRKQRHPSTHTKRRKVHGRP